MKKYNFKQDIDYRLLSGLVIGMVLVIGVFASDTMGLGPCPGPCQTAVWNGSNWQCVGCDSSCCNQVCINNQCQNCGGSSNKMCCPDMSHCCSFGQYCCGGECYDDSNQVCCGEQLYDIDSCMTCSNNNWVPVCPSDATCNDGHCCYAGSTYCSNGYNWGCCWTIECETCVDGFCKVCGGDPNKACCNGQCYDIRTKQCCHDATNDYICDINCKSCCNGSCCDSTKGEICKNGDCVTAVPTNMHQTSVRDLGDGTLEFEYAWDSTTGDKADLAGCTLGEKVDYPGGTPYYYWPSPPWTGRVDNPTILEGSAVTGHGTDDHYPPGFITPYTNASVSANQIYRYRKLPCITDYQTLLDIGSILRIVSGSGNLWRYSITKSGAYAEIFPLQ